MRKLFNFAVKNKRRIVGGVLILCVLVAAGNFVFSRQSDSSRYVAATAQPDAARFSSVRESRYDTKVILDFLLKGSQSKSEYAEIIDSIDFFKIMVVELYRREGYCPLPYYDKGSPAFGFGTRYLTDKKYSWKADWEALGVTDVREMRRLMHRDKYADQRKEIAKLHKMPIEYCKQAVKDYLEKDNQAVKNNIGYIPRNKRLAFLGYTYNAGYGSRTQRTALYKDIVLQWEKDVSMKAWVNKATTDNHARSRLLEAYMFKADINPNDLIGLLKMHEENMAALAQTNCFELAY